MRIANYTVVIAIVLVAVILTSLALCSETAVTVEIGDPVVREKYLFFLNEKQIKHEIDDNGVIKVYMKYDELQEQMADYEKWRKEYWKGRGVTIME